MAVVILKDGSRRNTSTGHTLQVALDLSKRLAKETVVAKVNALSGISTG